MKPLRFPLLFAVVSSALLAADPAPAPAPAPTLAPNVATVTAATTLKVGSSAIGLKPGTPLMVEGKSGDNLVVRFRKLRGWLPRKDTDFKGDVPDVALDAPKPTTSVAAASAPAPQPAAAKPATATPTPPSAVSDNPSSMYGKMVKKAQDNRDKHTDTLVDPTNEIMGK